MGPLSRCLSVLIYHRVRLQPDELFPDEVCAEDFDRQMRLLRRWFNVLPLREAVARMQENALPLRAASVTFDDGYADNATVALPILQRCGVPATFFVATGFLDGGRMWNDTVIEAVRRAPGDSLDGRSLGLEALDISSVELRRDAIGKILGALKYLPFEDRQGRVDELESRVGGVLPSGLMMTTQQLKSLHANGMEVGAHTVSHPILSRLDRTRALAEMDESKRRIETICGAPVSLFAYPNGRPGTDYKAEHVAMAKELGFAAAVSTAHGVSRKGSDLFQLPRFTPWDNTPGRFLLRLLRNTWQTRVEQV